MTYDDLKELHYILPIDNLTSVLENGLLSHRRAQKLGAITIADAEVQERRRIKRVPGARPLHDYVNLYIHARNPMMFRLQARHDELCVLSVRKEVIRAPGVVVSDRNASSDYARFADGDAGLSIVSRDLVYAQYWTSSDEIEQMRRKSAKCAEVLVPGQVGVEFIRGAYISCDEAELRIRTLAPDILLKQSPALFFR